MGGEDTTTTDTDQEVIIVTRRDREIHENNIVRDRILREKERVVVTDSESTSDIQSTAGWEFKRTHYLILILIILVILGYYFYTRE